MKISKELLLICLSLIFFALIANLSIATPPASPVGGVGIVIHAGNTTSSSSCGSIDTSCGVWPNCIDVTSLKYCVNGKVVESYCYSNTIKNRTRTTSCQNINIPVDFIVKNSHGSDESVDFDLYAPDANSSIGSYSVSGEDSFNFNNDVVDMMFRYDSDNFKFKLNKLNLTNVASQNVSMTFDIINPEIPNQFIIRAYRVELPQNFSYNSIKLYFKYDPNGVTNTSLLSVLKCNDYSVDDEECNGNWNPISFTINQTSGIVSADISGFSAYSLVELENQQTNQTNSTNTTNSTNQTNTTNNASNTQTNNNAAVLNSQSTDTTNNNQQASENPANDTSNPNTTATPKTDESNTQNNTQNQAAANSQISQKTSGAFALSMDNVQVIVLAVSIPVGALLLFFLRKNDLGRDNNITYPKIYKTKSNGNKKNIQTSGETRSSKNKKNRQTSEETHLVLQ